MTLVTAVLGAAALLVLVPAGVLIVQVTAAAAGRCAAEPKGTGQADRVARPRVAVLMPAHDEASVIVPTLQRVLPQLAPGDRVLVVADNCSDDTAALAAAAGAEVVERRNLDKRGKMYALEHGVRHLAADPPEVVIVVDADCHVEEGAIERLARECGRTGRPVQALYLMSAQKRAGLGGQVAEFAWIVKNWVRPLGMRNLGLSCQLMGTGTAFPWRAIANFDIANSEMAEDYKFGLDLARSSYPAKFFPAAVVRSEFPAREAAEVSQRTRWEHGHLQLILREVPRLLGRAVARGDGQLLGLALDLLVPPLAFLALALSALLLGTGLIAALGIAGWPLAIASLAALVYAAAIAVAWLGWGRRAISAGGLLALPRYVAAKLPIYVRFLTRRQRVWLKTERD